VEQGWSNKVFSPPEETLRPDSTVLQRPVEEQPNPVVVFTQYGPLPTTLKKFYNRGIVGYSSIHRAVRAFGFSLKDP